MFHCDVSQNLNFSHKFHLIWYPKIIFLKSIIRFFCIKKSRQSFWYQRIDFLYRKIVIFYQVKSRKGRRHWKFALCVFITSVSLHLQLYMYCFFETIKLTVSTYIIWISKIMEGHIQYIVKVKPVKFNQTTNSIAFNFI